MFWSWKLKFLSTAARSRLKTPQPINNFSFSLHQPVKKRLYSCSVFWAASNCSLECFWESLSRRYRGSRCSLRGDQQNFKSHRRNIVHQHMQNYSVFKRWVSSNIKTVLISFFSQFSKHSCDLSWGCSGLVNWIIMQSEQKNKKNKKKYIHIHKNNFLLENPTHSIIKAQCVTFQNGFIGMKWDRIYILFMFLVW